MSLPTTTLCRIAYNPRHQPSSGTANKLYCFVNDTDQDTSDPAITCTTCLPGATSAEYPAPTLNALELIHSGDLVSVMAKFSAPSVTDFSTTK